MADYSPLRYPGGKAKLYKNIKLILEKNSLRNSIYVEPFAGGAGLALNLLFKGDVHELILNDYDRSIYAFWHCCLYETDAFIDLIESTAVDIKNWYIQKEVQTRKSDVSLLELGFSTFYLNRTNRSGIIKAGVIGGLDQSGEYKIDCRFNKENLIKRIKLIGQHKKRISLHNLDAVALIENELVNLPETSFTFFDPPYYNKAEGLYTNFYVHNDHLELRDAIIDNMRTPYIITYDNADEILDMYSDFRRKDYDISYCASVKRTEKEIMIVNNLEFSDL